MSSISEFADRNHEAKGYRMIESFDIENFRCFEQASLKDLRTINIIVGDNGSGKTALLEALAMAGSAHPYVATRIRMSRNRPVPDQMAWNRKSFEEFWQDLFYNFNSSNVIAFKFQDSLIGNYTIKIFYDFEESTLTFSPFGPITPLLFKRVGPLETETTAKLQIDSKGNASIEGQLESLPNFYAFASNQQYYTADLVQYFSDLSKTGEVHDIIKTIKKDFNHLTNVAIEIDAGVPFLYATLKNMTQKLPITIVSSGLAKYLNILLAIYKTQKGIVLIDEIENGIYWKRMPNIWKTIRNYCYDNGVQLFITTHSNECLQSLLPAMKKNVEDFALIRAEVNDKGEYKLRQFNGKSFKAALIMRGEVR